MPTSRAPSGGPDRAGEQHAPQLSPQVSLAPRLRLKLLGDFEVTCAGEPVRLSAPAQRVTALVAVMHRDRPVRRTALAERLWPDAPAGRATQNLRSLLWRMPRPRGRAVLTSTAENVRLHPELTVDLWEAERQVGQLCSPERPSDQLLDDLSGLHQDLLPDWPEEWLEVERESFRQQRLHALESSAQLLCEGGRFSEALSAGFTAVTCEPLRESAHRRVIAVHLAEGNQAEALRQYHRYRRLIGAELGLPPSPEIRRMVAPLLGRPVDSRR